MKQYTTTIGLEIHCELKTATKIFCACENTFGGAPNSHCCPICSGHPGVLPKLNERAVEFTVRAGLALNCDINLFCKWDRKNYFYPDLPKAWQTSQYDLPLVGKGVVHYVSNGEKKSVRINRIHLEEDAGKLVHEGGRTLVDYNRCGVPLMEIVTEPDLHSADDVTAFLTELKTILKYTGVSDVKMQEGSLRCDVNLSVSSGEELGTRTETKNLNSFSAAKRCILYETQRQIDLIESGQRVVQETRRWDDAKGEGSGMRSKEDAHDYRYFPEPDLMPVTFTDKDIERIRQSIPELKSAKFERYTRQLGLPEYDAEIITSDVSLASLFDEVNKTYQNAKKTSNFLMSEVLRLAKDAGSEDLSIGVKGESVAQILSMIEKGEISLVAARSVLEYIWNQDITPMQAVEKLGLKQNNDVSQIEEIVKEIIKNNPKVADDYRSGNTKVVSFFVGQVMKATQGKSNPKIVNDLLAKLL